MSSHPHIHLGPYLQCQNGEAEKEKTIRSCTNKTCKDYGSQVWESKTKFCSLCGSPIDNITIKTKGRKVNTDPCQVGEALICTYHLEEEDADIWVGNLHRPNKDDVRSYGWCPHYDSPDFDEITPEMIEEEKQEFVTQYKEAMEKLGKLYNQNVVLKWGLIQYWN